MANKAKYLFQMHPLVMTEDLPVLPAELRTAFSNDYRSILSADPYGCSGFPNHDLIGRLKDYRTLEIDWEGISYRLVYRVYESPAPKRVFVVSFDEHNQAYEKAKERTGRVKYKGWEMRFNGSDSYLTVRRHLRFPHSHQAENQ